MRFAQLFLRPLALCSGAPVRFTESNDETGKNHKADHSRNRSFGIFQRKGMGRWQKPIPDTYSRKQGSDNGRPESAVPCGKDYCRPYRVIRIVFPEKWSEQFAEQQ